MKKSLLILSAAALIICILIGCSNTGTPAVTDPQTVTGQIETDPVSVECIYTIVRGQKASEEEIGAAAQLAKLFRELGADVEVVDDWYARGGDLEASRHENEILIGKTNRSESAAPCDKIGQNTESREMLDYILSSDGEDYIIAAADGFYGDAVEFFAGMISDDPSMLSKTPKELILEHKHDFPLEDIVICGVSVAEYDGIAYRDDYSAEMMRDISGLSDFVFNSCGYRLKTQKKSQGGAGRFITVGERTDADVKSGGEFSYGLIPSESGLVLEGKDVWGDWCAMDKLCETIKAGCENGGALSINEPIRRITDPAKDDRLGNFQLAGWVIAADDMSNEEQFAEIADCGFNQIIIHTDRKNTELNHNYCKWMAKYQLRGIWSVSETNLWGWLNDDRKFVSPHIVGGDSVTWGHMIADEPSMKYYGDIAELCKEYETLFEGKVPHVNLLPNYANSLQLGTSSYQEYVDEFIKIVQPKYLSMDFYPLHVGQKIADNYFVNLEIISTACRKNNIPFAYYIQSVSFNTGVMTPTEQGMRWQIYNSLAFGAMGIEYFTYRTPNSGTESFKNALIARDNTKTDRWYAAQKINAELAAFTDVYMKYNHLGSWGVNMQNAPSFFYFSNQYGGFDAIENISVTGDKSLLMGGFEDDNGNNAFVCVNNSSGPDKRTEDIDVTVRLASGCKGITLYQSGKATELTADSTGNVTFTLSCGEGIFAEITRK